MMFELVLFFSMAASGRSMAMTPAMPAVMSQKFQTEAECQKIVKELVDAKIQNGPVRGACIPLDSASIAAVSARLKAEVKANPEQKPSKKDQDDDQDGMEKMPDLYKSE